VRVVADMKLIERMDTQNKRLLLRRGGRGQIKRVCTSDCVYIFHKVEVQMDVCWLQPGLKCQEQRTPWATRQWHRESSATVSRNRTLVSRLTFSISTIHPPLLWDLELPKKASCFVCNISMRSCPESHYQCRAENYIWQMSSLTRRGKGCARTVLHLKLELTGL
jgi:hypothetical protein